GDLDGAIHTWTRVLFIDRGHARARAYIERARVVQAERQRRSDELVHGGVAAFEEGDSGRAKELLSSAVAQGAPDALALAVLQRLDRLEARSSDVAIGVDEPLPEPESSSAPVPGRASRVGRWLAVCAAVLLVVAGALVVAWDRLDAWLGPPPASVGLTLRADPGPLPLPRSSDLVLRRARALHARGHLAEALEILGTVGVTDPLRPQVDQLRTDIERQLLATVEPVPEPSRSPTQVAPRP
ncbi:MAG: hypothetical protein H6Q08_1533, partial [Acidobacteria bacterium]|nr:hypothetical protein [Acidobacteriota bacterium]